MQTATKQTGFLLMPKPGRRINDCDVELAVIRWCLILMVCTVVTVVLAVAL